MPSLNPATPQQLAETLRVATASERPIHLGGCFTKRAFGGPIDANSETISTSSLTCIIEYEPKDLTLSVEAGVRYADLRRLLAENRQMLPFDPPWAETATIGGIVAANTNGPRRRLYGSIRDFVIGMRFATVEGKLIETGGMVVKNVAGLDMQKLLIGSYGTLAALASVNFKLVPAPPATRTFLMAAPQWELLVAARDGLLGSVLQPAAVDLLNAKASSRCGLTGPVLAVRAGGTERVLDRYQSELKQFEAFDGEREAEFWRSVEEFTPRFLADSPSGCVVRVSSTLAGLPKVLASLPEAGVGRAASGVVYGYFATPGHARAWLDRHRPELGPVVFEAVQEAEKSKLALWPVPGDDFDVMKRVKALFDPNNRLNPGRLHGRL